MIQITVKQALLQGVKEYDEHVLYIVRDGAAVFYIGHSYDPIARLQQHMLSDALGMFISENKPDSYQWQFEMLTFGDCQFCLQQVDYSFISHLNYSDQHDRKVVEGYLIAYYHPCINAHNNPYPAPLPAQYKNPYTVEVGLTDNLY